MDDNGGFFKSLRLFPHSYFGIILFRVSGSNVTMAEKFDDVSVNARD